MNVLLDHIIISALALGRLEKRGLKMVPVRQGYKSMSPPSKELERWLQKGELAHNGDPVLRWNASHIAVKTDENGNIRPIRSSRQNRVDGLVAFLMAMSRSMLYKEKRQFIGAFM